MSIFRTFKIIPLFLISTTVFLLVSCNNIAENRIFSLFSTENILINLPEYPTDNYPTLSGWLIKTRLNEEVQYQRLNPNSKKASVKLQKNKASPILVWPIICTPSKMEEVIFFLPAGCIYPYSKEAKWNAGFSAHIFDTLLEKNTDSSTEDFLSRFNWNKLQTNIEEKEKKAQAKSEDFNPWHLNQENILKTISSGKFSVHQIKEKDKSFVQISLENKDVNIYSNYIPVNIHTKQENGKYYFDTAITLANDKYSINPENLFLQDDYSIGVIITNKKHKTRLVRTELQRYTKKDENE